MNASARMRRLGLGTLLAAGLAGVGGCGQKAPTPEQFVGKWRSSRMNAVPLYLRANGEWEIRADADDKVMQYGIWELNGRSLVWYIKQDGRLMREGNAIVSVAPQRFELREQDGSVTRFERLD